VNPYASDYHQPVLCKAVVNGLIGKPDGNYVDGTLGGGGHTAALLDALTSDGRVIGIDQDAEALAAASGRLEGALESGRLTLVRGNFERLSDLVSHLDIDEIDGILLDLGVSSHQFDAGHRGFSHRLDGPLDMRMDSASMNESAADLLSRMDERELRQILREYGEEPRASRIARAITEGAPLGTTAELAETIRRAVPSQDQSKSLARVFQALRIAVNRELDVLERVLQEATRMVRPGGRIAVIAYHSLEDRRVKRFLRYGNFEGHPERDFLGNLLAPWSPVNRRPIVPEAQELESNPRARSARLRLAERQQTS
jgi:16S rRNA (cytosine1402-N4)-methyltransferase